VLSQVNLHYVSGTSKKMFATSCFNLVSFLFLLNRVYRNKERVLKRIMNGYVIFYHFRTISGEKIICMPKKISTFVFITKFSLACLV
jgi:hypothetical protein